MNELRDRLKEQETYYGMACLQLTVLNQRFEQLAKRYDRADKLGQKSFRYSLQFLIVIVYKLMDFVVGGLVNGGRGGEHVIDMPAEERKVEVRYTCSYTWVSIYTGVFQGALNTHLHNIYREFIYTITNDHRGNFWMTPSLYKLFYSRELRRAPLTYTLYRNISWLM